MSFVQPAMKSPVFAVISDMIVLVVAVIATTLALLLFLPLFFPTLLCWDRRHDDKHHRWNQCSSWEVRTQITMNTLRVSPWPGSSSRISILDSRVVDGLPGSFQSEIPSEES